MSTFLFDKIIFGPVNSRRLGVSLGINLLPTTVKVCSFNCIYCECGWNGSNKSHEKLPTRAEVARTLEAKLQEMILANKLPDVITFAGNGEPTLHPEFAEIIDDTIELRNRFCPKAKVAVLSNATRIDRDKVFNALLKVDQNILKLDTASDSIANVLNQPTQAYSVAQKVEELKRFKGKFILQTLFIQGDYNGTTIDNSTAEEVDKWLKIVDLLKPSEVMVYTISRDTPAEGLRKVSTKRLNEIAQLVENLGVAVSVSS
ncbi:radical SAM protein [Williamwhitmania taraxaci]|uniref:Wyosine [tRNA(Phe)-imidazoG37] synthetase, radical SAM superfamily n=1 Tax=Williamwhitmania taraxaci TaxID=1640674 RepID=A0A1G6PG20_9BACT|nr:radical SAM protein [Williamwhitmania taraxaci]SDC78494.1 Wyosine [tRNA(Phe)-imidazoG37] synthetase, radical SAM superfamily [Williamwhitmania taraxaci]